MEIKECKSDNLIIKEVEKLLFNIVNEIKDSYNPKILEVNSTYFDSIKHISVVNSSITKFIGINIYEEIIYKHIVTISFCDRNLKIEIEDPNEFLNFLIKEKFTEFAINNKDSIKSLCFISDF